MIRLAALLAVAAFAGCATSPASTATAPPAKGIINTTLLFERNGYPVLIVKRDTGVAGFGCNHRISVDGKPVADLRPGESLTMYPEPGEHIVSLRQTLGFCNGEHELQVTMKAGERRVLRSATEQGGVHAMLMPTSY